MYLRSHILHIHRSMASRQIGVPKNRGVLSSQWQTRRSRNLDPPQKNNNNSPPKNTTTQKKGNNLNDNNNFRGVSFWLPFQSAQGHGLCGGIHGQRLVRRRIHRAEAGFRWSRCKLLGLELGSAQIVGMDGIDACILLALELGSGHFLSRHAHGDLRRHSCGCALWRYIVLVAKILLIVVAWKQAIFGRLKPLSGFCISGAAHFFDPQSQVVSRTLSTL